MPNTHSCSHSHSTFFSSCSGPSTRGFVCSSWCIFAPGELDSCPPILFTSAETIAVKLYRWGVSPFQCSHSFTNPIIKVIFPVIFHLKEQFTKDPAIPYSIIYRKMFWWMWKHKKCHTSTKHTTNLHCWHHIFIFGSIQHFNVVNKSRHIFL